MRTLLHNEKVLVLGDQAIFSGTTFAITALLARFLGLELFGLYSSVVLGIYLLISMSNALIIQPMQVAYSKFENNESYLGFTLIMQVAIILLVALLFIITSYVAPHLVSDYLGINLFLVSALAASWLAHDYFRKTFLALQAIKKTIVVDCLMAGIQLTGIIGLGVTHQLTLDATIIILTIGFTSSSILSFVIGDIKFSHLRFNRNYFEYHKKEGSVLFASSLLQWWSGNLFVVASGIFLGVAALGAFRLVQSMFGILNLLLQTYENYVLPKAAKLFADSKNHSKSYLRSITSKGDYYSL